MKESLPYASPGLLPQDSSSFAACDWGTGMNESGTRAGQSAAMRHTRAKRHLLSLVTGVVNASAQVSLISVSEYQHAPVDRRPTRPACLPRCFVYPMLGQQGRPAIPPVHGCNKDKSSPPGVTGRLDISTYTKAWHHPRTSSRNHCSCI